MKCIATAATTASTASIGLTLRRVLTRPVSSTCSAASINVRPRTKLQGQPSVLAWAREAAARKGRLTAKAQNTPAASTNWSLVAAKRKNNAGTCVRGPSKRGRLISGMSHCSRAN